jgi:RHH-type proline utilization regulon transcriptional repressor/proline dehydrogenase/delta 1-pyrroline-5-carboxylate dehydrogenase
VLPTLIEIDRLAELEREVFGPVLHVLRYDREDLAALLGQINATGYGLTLGVHTRIDETVAQVVDRAHAGNIYVNRNVVGAVVGVQPFGGEGLSGTGPKAGGPLYLLRLLSARPDDDARAAVVASGAEAPAPIRGLAMGDDAATRPAGAASLGAGAAAGRARRLDRGDRPLRRAFAGRPLALASRPDRRGQSLRRGAARSRALPRRPTTATG